MTTKKLVKMNMNRLLAAVLKVFHRMSRQIESETDFFPLNVYQELVYNNWLFDIAKLYDIIAVYGHSNPTIVKSIVESVFENDKRYI